MKTRFILLALGVFLLATTTVFAQNFVLDGGTLKCDAATVGDTNSTVIPGKTYTAVDNTLLNSMFSSDNWNGTDPIYVCTSKVTNMANLFKHESDFNQDIGNWDVSNVTNMSSMFYYATVFNQDISGWDVSNVTDMSSMFYYARAFNQDISSWNVANVTDMKSMFYFARVFNQDINSWNVSNVTDMSSMFHYSLLFNQSIDGWNVSNVTTMRSMFNNARVFNQNLNNWNVANVTDMGYMFQDAEVFDGNISNWNVSSVTNMNSMFQHAYNFNQDISGWNVISVTNTSDMFIRVYSFNQDLSGWDVSNVTDMSSMFEYAYVFNQDIGSWNVSNVTNMSTMFYRARDFNQNLNNWNVTNVTDMRDMFQGAEDFDGNISGWVVSNVTKMTNMFREATVFNQDLSGWNVANVTDASYMFHSASAFNQNIGSWNVSNVTNMNGMFYKATAFNQDLSSWNVSNVTGMYSMFYNATVFNQDISSWNVANVTNMEYMFNKASAFNQDISSWDVSNVTEMKYMFAEASVFNQNINSWNVSKVKNMSYLFFNAPVFNQDLSNWDVSSVTDMRYMFSEATAFNQDLSNWDLSSVSNMRYMFAEAPAFNQDLSNWDVSSVTDMKALFYLASSFNQDISSWDVSNVTNFSYTFSNMAVFNQDLSNWDLSSASNLSSMFSGASIFNQNLTNWCVVNVPSLPSNFNANSALESENFPVWGTCPNYPTLTGIEGWRMLATPISDSSYSNFLSPLWTQGITGSDAPTASQANVFTWKTTTATSDATNWVALSDMNNTLHPGSATLVYVFGDDNYTSYGNKGFPKKLPLFGNLATGDQNLTANLNTNNGGFTLLGNPFRVDVDWKQFTKSDLAGTVYIWDANSSSWKSNSGGAAGSLEDGIIGAFNGFFVQTNGASPALTIPETAKQDSAKNFLGKQVAADEPVYFSLELQSEAGLSNKAWFQFSEKGDLGIDDSDAHELTPLSSKYVTVASVTNNTLLDINNLPVLENTLEIPIEINTTESGTHSFRFNDVHLPKSWLIELYDNETNNKISLEQHAYEFTVPASKVLPNQKKDNLTLPSLTIMEMGSKSKESSPRFSLRIVPSSAVGNEILTDLPQTVDLQQNYPNPFNPSTTITFTLPQSGDVTLEVFDVLGRKVATLLNAAAKSAGNHSITFDATNISSGMYMYRLKAGNTVITKKLTLLK